MLSEAEARACPPSRRALRGPQGTVGKGSGYPLQVLAALVPRSAVGFPLLSLTRGFRGVRVDKLADPV